MWNTIWEAIQPIVNEIAKDIIGLSALLLLIAYGFLKSKILSYIKNEMLHKVASEGFAHAETKFKDLSGTDKMNKAFIYVSGKLGKARIKVTAEEIDAAIEKAVLEYNSKKKAS